MLKSCKLYVIIDRCLIENRDILKVVEDALRGGADIIQLRDKSSDDRALLRYAKDIKQITKRYKRLFIVNDRADIAYAADADGVHLGQDDIQIEEARKILGGKIIGISTHSVGEAERAQRKGADYIGIGPIFETATKKGPAPIGPSILTEVRKRIDIPFFAIGGISLANIMDVKKNGADRIAVAYSATQAGNVYDAVKELKEMLSQDDTVRSCQK